MRYTNRHFTYLLTYFQLSSSSSFRDNRESQIYIKGPCASGRFLTEKFWHTGYPEVLPYTYITVSFHLRSSIKRVTYGELSV